MKGIYTTEFWVTIVTGIVGTLMSAGVFSPEQGDSIIQVVGALVVAIASFGYNLSRGLAKKNAEIIEIPEVKSE